MNKLIFKLMVPVLALTAAVSCNQKEHIDYDLLSGDWKLTTLGGVPVEDLGLDKDGGSLDVYISFDGAGSFETFQRLSDSDRYVRYDGWYSVSGSVASGQYSDGVMWATDYVVSYENDNLIMTGGTETCVYARAQIPSEVRDDAVPPFWTRSADGETVPPRFL